MAVDIDIHALCDSVLAALTPKWAVEALDFDRADGAIGALVWAGQEWGYNPYGCAGGAVGLGVVQAAPPSGLEIKWVAEEAGDPGSPKPLLLGPLPDELRHHLESLSPSVLESVQRSIQEFKEVKEFIFSIVASESDDGDEEGLLGSPHLACDRLPGPGAHDWGSDPIIISDDDEEEGPRDDGDEEEVAPGSPAGAHDSAGAEIREAADAAAALATQRAGAEVREAAEAAAFMVVQRFCGAALDLPHRSMVEVATPRGESTKAAKRQLRSGVSKTRSGKRRR